MIKKDNKIIKAIQSCYILDEKNKDREIQGLLEAMEKFKLKEGLILTAEQEDEITINRRKIKVISVWKWLLEK